MPQGEASEDRADGHETGKSRGDIIEIVDLRFMGRSGYSLLPNLLTRALAVIVSPAICRYMQMKETLVLKQLTG